jgi:hypothetical protein
MKYPARQEHARCRGVHYSTSLPVYSDPQRMLMDSISALDKTVQGTRAMPDSARGRDAGTSIHRDRSLLLCRRLVLP